MKIEMNDFWNGIEQTLEGETALDSKVAAKHNIFHHSITWFDAKTTTVLQAIEFTDSENIKNSFDQIDLMLLVKHESTEGWSCLQYATGFYEKSYNRISQFRFCFETKEYSMLPIEGELLAFAFVDDLPLMRIFNEDEEM
jgi:hypothetical protein